jgi:glycosyltransferase involved in cell wall biosynthesis
VSVIIPTYNRCALVTQAIDCALAQERVELELIVVDDGSTDETYDVLKRRLDGEPRAHILRKKNGGTASARNLGIANARAVWTAFLDSDDLWEPHYLESQLAALDAQPWADLVVGNATYVNQGRKADSLFADPDFRPPSSLAAMCSGAWALPSAIVVRTGIARALGFTNRYRIIEDTEFLLRFHARGHHAILNADRLASWRRPQEPGAAAKTESRLAIETEMLDLLYANVHLAPDPQAAAHRYYNLHRWAAKRLVQEGRYGEARPHLRAWCRARPLRLRPRFYYLRSLLSPQRRR